MGLPATGRMLLRGMPLDPPRAGITTRTDMGMDMYKARRHSAALYCMLYSAPPRQKRPPGGPVRFIITGATGYTGRHLLQDARERGHDLAVYIRQRARLRGDVAARSYDAPLPAAFHGADALINLAGRAHTTDTGAGHDAFDEANHQLPRRLADQARQAGVRRFVHVSSIGVYGNTRDEPLNEAAPLAPDTPYARS